MKSLAKRLLSLTPYRIVKRTRLNRFQAIDEALISLARRGYRPKLIIDGGANRGDFVHLALKIFPDAVVHAFEPQPGCQPYLERLKPTYGNRLVIHAAALCAPEDGTSMMMLTDEAAISTGAKMAAAIVEVGKRQLTVQSTTLDAAIAPFCSATNNMLLKLDLQGFELHALRGAKYALAVTDVVLTEVSFYAQAYEPPIAELVRYLADHGFDLYDIASLYARPRDDRPRQGDFLFVRRESELARDRSWE